MRRAIRIALVACGLAGVACDRAAGPAAEAHGSVLTTVEEAKAPITYALNSLSFIEGHRLVEATPSGGRPSFLILSREARLARTPCSRCHTVPLASMRWDGSDGRRRAHWSVDLAHAPAEVMQCATCHAVDEAGPLRLLGGRPVGFDHAYQTCAQCHAGEAADWAGGAHGKRVGGWVPPRVVFNCTECHDPHRPALSPRWPAQAGRLPGTARNQ